MALLPEKITVETPPHSPVLFSMDAFDVRRTHETVSPTKRKKKGGHNRRPKRQKKGNTLACDQVTEQPNLLNEEPPCAGRQKVDGYTEYAAAVAEHVAGFYPLSDELFVVQGWDGKSGRVKNTWYHLQRVMAGDEVHIVCICPQGRGSSQTPCIHEQYIRRSYEEILQESPVDVRSQDPSVVTLFARQEGQHESRLYLFSVLSQQVGSHAIVLFDGNNTGMGSWSCMKDHESTCQHILLAQDELQNILEADGSHIEEWNEASGDEGTNDGPKSTGDTAISYRPILPPRWCSLQSDQFLYAYPQPLEQSPGTIELEASHSQCACGAKYNPTEPTGRVPCVIYGLLRAIEAKVELQHCPTCNPRRRQYIGPDARERGIFNWSNQIMFTHDLLNEYTSAFSTSETPFVAWAQVIIARYETYESKHPFVSVGLFRSAWFAFVQLQDFSNDMRCAICGPNPENIIWDGVTVAFSKKKLLPSLQPPTTTSINSPIRDNVRYYPNQQLIPDRETRQLVLKALASHRRIRTDREDLDPEVGEVECNTALQESNHLEILELAEERLKRINAGLGALFAQKIGSGCGPTSPAPLYFELFRQIASDDTVLRLGTTDDMGILDEFLLKPTPFNASRLVSIPILCQVLKAEQLKDGAYPPPVLKLAQWIRSRARDVLEHLVDHSATLGMDSEMAGKDDWQQTGTFYSFPRIRSRPIYPNLKQEKESSKRGGKCSKYYNDYAEDRLTGGIMAAWCSHIICYGFHCIPKSEGRNDVFSAMVTRWPQAPKHVIYDFACSLGPYCMLREPEFFGNTKFLIDNFHASNHTKCDRAWFLSSYSSVYPQLAKINSSAAECGNSALHRIRKSISYMSQGHAVLYLKVFISVWNRRKLRGVQNTANTRPL